MTHCRTPSSCSVCLGAPVRRIALVAGTVVIDGVATGRSAIDNDIPAHMVRSRRRGGQSPHTRRNRK